MKKTSNMKASNMKRVLLSLALLAGLSTMTHAQTYREITNTKLIINSSYPSGNAVTLRTGAGQTAYTLYLPAAAPTSDGEVLRVDPSATDHLIWTSPLDMYVFENGLEESGTNTVKWGGSLTGATTINTNGANALSFVNNGAGTGTMTIGGGAGTLTLDVRAGTTINTSGTANTEIGNSTGTFALTSSGLNITSAGVLSDDNSNLIINDNVEPATDDTYTMGADTKRWSDVFIGPNTLHIGTATAGGDEFALSYNTTANKAVFNVGSTNTMELTSTALTVDANLTANGAVALGNSDGGVVAVHSTGGLIINSESAADANANLTLVETQISRNAPLTILGKSVNGAKQSSMQFSADVKIESDVVGGTITLVSNAESIFRSLATSGEVAEISLDQTTGKVEMYANDGVSGGYPMLTIADGTDAGSITLEARDVVLDANIELGSASSNVITFYGNIAQATPLVFEGGTSDGVTTSFTFVDPTSNRIITFPDASGTVLTTGNADDLIWEVGGNDGPGTNATRKIGLTTADALDIITNNLTRVTISSDGSTSFAGAASVSGILTASSTTNATSSSTGSLVTAGGLGVAQDVYVGGNTSLTGTLTVTSNLTANGAVALGNSDGEVVAVHSTGGLIINSEPADADANLTLLETQIRRNAPLTILGKNSAGTEESTIELSNDIELNSDVAGGNINVVAGGVALIQSKAASGETAEILLSQTGSAIDMYVDNNLDISYPTFTIADGTDAGTITLAAKDVVLNANVELGSASSNLVTFYGTIAGATPLVFEGGTSDGITTSFAIAQPTASSKTITFPNVTGTVLLTEGTQTLNGSTNFSATASFQSALQFPFNRNTAAANVTIGANDFVVIQAGAGSFILPAGANGRMLILKNTSGATRNITPATGETCDAATLADGASVIIIFNGTNWYQVGN